MIKNSHPPGKGLSGIASKSKDLPVRDREGSLLQENVDIRNKWREHFETVLNRPVPPEEDIPPDQEDLNIKKGEIRLEEVVKQLKNYKTAGGDGLFLENFKVEENELVFFLKMLFSKIWVTGIVPAGWKISR